jgi:hypothetical protein
MVSMMDCSKPTAAAYDTHVLITCILHSPWCISRGRQQPHTHAAQYLHTTTVVPTNLMRALSHVINCWWAAECQVAAAAHPHLDVLHACFCCIWEEHKDLQSMMQEHKMVFDVATASSMVVCSSHMTTLACSCRRSLEFHHWRQHSR